MSGASTADQFLYTAACFGSAGSEGFQFVGLPEAGAAQELVGLIEHHIDYTPPIDAPPTPSDADIAARYPVSVRLLFPDAGERAALISARYVGRTYRAAGERGKWGNFFVHALLLSPGTDPRTLAALASQVSWRTGLTEQEHRAEQMLLLPPLAMRASAQASTGEVDEELLAAVLCRLTGGPPVLMVDVDHRMALKRYACVQAALPAALARRLSWSTYEFDGACGYDVIATQSQTQLSLAPAGYVVLGVTDVPTEFSWAARQICAGAQDFWGEVLALAGASFEPATFKTALVTLMQLAGAEVPQASLVTAALASVRNRPADAATVAAARRLFDRVFRPGRLGDFTVLAAAASEAKAFAAWSGTGEWSEGIGRLVSGTAPVSACFNASPDPRPLTSALLDAARAGLPPETAALLILDAHQDHLRARGDTGALHSAVHMFLHEALARSAADSWGRVLAGLARSPKHWAAITQLIKLEAKLAGGPWVDGVLNVLDREVTGFASTQSPALLEYLLVEGFADRPGEVAWRVSALRRLPTLQLMSRQSTGQRLATLVEELDLHIGQLRDGSEQAQLAARLVDFCNQCPAKIRPKETQLANSTCLLAASNGDAALALVNDTERFKAVTKRAQQSCYFVLALAAWTECEGMTDAKDRKALFLQLWRETLDRDFSARVLESLGSELARSKAPLEFLVDALSATVGSTPGQQAWRDVIERLATQLAPRLDDGEFDKLIKLRGLDKELREALQARRTYSLRGLRTALGKLAQSAVSRMRGRR